MSYTDTLKQFQNLSNLSDLAYFLGFQPKTLSYIIFKLGGGINGQYYNFTIKKRNGKIREISAPLTSLMEVQKRLNKKLTEIYLVKKSAHGFIPKRSIISNATNHSRKKFVFNIDLKNFFPSIHFGRVLGLLQSRPYLIKRDVAVLMTKIVCYNDILPQGSPCSPVISNMICSYMDRQLSDLAKEFGCFYTRYADDITFSTNRRDFPKTIATFGEGAWLPGKRLKDLISKQGFEINSQKTSLRTRSDRQLVTGLVVNDRPNIRRKSLKQVRAMLHDWKTNGLDQAFRNYISREDIKSLRNTPSDPIHFTKVVRGKLEFIRTVRNHRIKLLNHIDKEESIRKREQYNRRNFQSDYHDQYYKYIIRYQHLIFRDCEMATIIGEGETDWMHLRKAYYAIKSNIKDIPELNIYKHKKYINGGWTNLKYFCENADKHYVKFNKPIICVFDRDIGSINNIHKGKEFLFWGNNIFSIVLSKPDHRTTEDYSIEQLYFDKDLLQEDVNHRRLYLSSEFHNNGKLKKNSGITYGKRAKDGKEINGWKKTIEGPEKIIDDGVCAINGPKVINIALSKKDFATYVYKAESPFVKIEFSAFTPTFKIISKICNLTEKEISKLKKQK
ncbi:reverse transcriptase domain-containing protein [Maridesulfovibrio sp.]|uniref:reverse transcriptase domain-containing protein n=1 Tax=Maridesulfovibrio sp. TaxID=2795000 RepID=UPI002A186E83|nr:reverse transcriptase domain-containing protein [Maridesulfovibrio sp.]